MRADGPMVENPILRVDAVDEARTTVPTRIPVSASLSEDGKRRKTIAAMARSVARVDWKITRKGHDVELVLKPSGVREQTVLMREPWFQPGDHVTIRRGRAKVHEAVLNPDPRVMLEEARRSGERLRLVLGRVTL